MQLRPPAWRGWARWSLRRRLVSVAGIALVGLLAAAVTLFSVALESILVQSATRAAQLQAGQIAAVVAAGEYTPTAAVTALPAQGAVLQVLDRSGAVVAASDPALLAAPITTSRPARGASEVARADQVGDEKDPYVVVAQGIADRQGTPYTLVVAAPLGVETRTVSSATTLLAAGAALLTLVLLVAVGNIVTRALAPVEHIRGEVSQISRTGAGARITVPPSGDEIARLAETMNGMLERLSRSDAAARRFVSDASHELRSPIATLRTHLETSPGDGRGHVLAERDLALAEVARLQSLVEDLLTLAKADDQGLVLRDEEVDLDDVVDAEIRRVRTVTAVPVRAHVEPALVRGDGDRLVQVLRNVVDNAVRHTTGEVFVGMDRSEPGWVSVHVDNDGPPIPPAQRELVFGRFARLESDRGRDRGGSGLGLAIAATYTRAHGGSLTTGEDQRGRCRFTLRLPLAD